MQPIPIAAIITGVAGVIGRFLLPFQPLSCSPALLLSAATRTTGAGPMLLLASAAAAILLLVILVRWLFRGRRRK